MNLLETLLYLKHSNVGSHLDLLFSSPESANDAGSLAAWVDPPYVSSTPKELLLAWLDL